MPATGGSVRSDNKVVQGGPYRPIFIEGAIGGSGQSILPGSLVKPGASHGLYIVAGTADQQLDLGVLDAIFSEFVTGSRGGQAVGVAVTTGEKCRVAFGTFLFRALLSTSQTIAEGVALTVDAAGRMKIAASTDTIHGYAAEAVTTTGTVLPILVRKVNGGKF